MKHMHRWSVDMDNVKFYDAIMKNKGCFHTLDSRTYIELLNEFNIFYTVTKG